MANTTNYSWETADDSDLVKDGAAAMRTLGQAIDTTVKALNPETTLGDISYRSSTANTNTRLGIGSSGQILTVSGGVPAWATPASAGGMTSLASGTLSGSSVTLSSISSGYTHLFLELKDFYFNAGSTIDITFNTDTSSTIYRHGYYGATSASPSFAGTSETGGKYRMFWIGPDAAQNNNYANLTIFNYAGTTHHKLADSKTSYVASSNRNYDTAQGVIPITSAINQIIINAYSGTTFSGGTYTLWGVK